MKWQLDRRTGILKPKQPSRLENLSQRVQQNTGCVCLTVADKVLINHHVYGTVATLRFVSGRVKIYKSVKFESLKDGIKEKISSFEGTQEFKYA